MIGRLQDIPEDISCFMEMKGWWYDWEKKKINPAASHKLRYHTNRSFDGRLSPQSVHYEAVLLQKEAGK